MRAPGPSLDHDVDGLGVADTGGNKRNGLSFERVLQAVADKTRHVAAHMHRCLPGIAQQLHGRPQNLGAGLFALDHLHERDKVRRVPKMRAGDALAVLEMTPDLGGRNGR